MGPRVRRRGVHSRRGGQSISLRCENGFHEVSAHVNRNFPNEKEGVLRESECSV